MLLWRLSHQTLYLLKSICRFCRFWRMQSLGTHFPDQRGASTACLRWAWPCRRRVHQSVHAVPTAVVNDDSAASQYNMNPSRCDVL